MMARVNDTKASMTRLKTSITSEMAILKASLAKHNAGGNVSWKAMEWSLEHVWKEWLEVEELYQTILALTDVIEVDADKEAYMKFQLDLFTLRDQIQEVIDAGRETTENRKNEVQKETRLKTFGDKFNAAYNRIDTMLAELKLGLSDAETVFSLDLLNHKSERLSQIRNQLDVADTYVESLFAIEAEQDTVSIATQGEKRTAAEVVIEQCEGIIRTKKAVIEEKIATEKAAANRAIVDTAATIIATPTPTTSADPGKMTPRLERLDLPFFSGKLCDYAKWR